METEFKGTFRRDLVKIKDKAVRRSVGEVIENIEQAVNITQIQFLVKLRDYQVHYRVEVKGNYRIDVIVRGNKVWFARILHRSKIYKDFP